MDLIKPFLGAVRQLDGATAGVGVKVPEAHEVELPDVGGQPA